MQIARQRGERGVIREPLKQLSDVGHPEWPFKAGLDLFQAFRKGQSVLLVGKFPNLKFKISNFRPASARPQAYSHPRFAQLYFGWFHRWLW
jgi:hypothetical protein